MWDTEILSRCTYIHTHLQSTQLPTPTSLSHTYTGPIPTSLPHTLGPLLHHSHMTCTHSYITPTWTTPTPTSLHMNRTHSYITPICTTPTPTSLPHALHPLLHHSNMHCTHSYITPTCTIPTHVWSRYGSASLSRFKPHPLPLNTSARHNKVNRFHKFLTRVLKQNCSILPLSPFTMN